MATNSQTREIGRMYARADVVPNSIDEEARTVDVVWTTGARVKRYSWFDGPWYEELSTDPNHVRMSRLQSGRAPVLLQHNSWNPDAHQGVIESARMANGEGTARLRFLKGDEDADKTWNKIRQGVLTSVSVGYDIHKMEKVEGGDETIPVFRAVDWEPYEISPVSMPADPDAHMRSSGDAARTHPCEIITRGMAPQKEKHMEKQETQTPAPDAAARLAELNAAREASAKAERERSASITAIVRGAGLDATFGEKLVADGVTLDKARELVLNKLAERSDAAAPAPTPSGQVEAGATEREKRLRGMSGWLLERAGVGDVIEKAREHKKFGRQLKGVVLDGGEFRGMSMLDMARAFLEAAGVNTRGMDKMTLVGRAFTFRGSGGYQTTSDFGVLFENVMHKLLLASYATVDDTWRQFCGTTTVSDFRPSNRFRTGSFGTLDDLNEAGEFKNKAFPDGEKSTVTTGTKGNIIGLSRQTIINDDMGALADLAAKFGRAAGLTIESSVYALLAQNSGLGPTQTDSQPFFHSNRANVNATGSVLGVAGLDADRVVMGSQKDISNNEYLNLRPSVLLVPLGLGGDARVHNDAQYDTTASKLNVPNKVRGLFRNIVDTARLTGTRRYLFTDPATAPAIVVAFLEGQGEAPVLESQDGWRVDGTEWKVRLDAKAQMFDPRGAVTNAGA